MADEEKTAENQATPETATPDSTETTSTAENSATAPEAPPPKEERPTAEADVEINSSDAGPIEDAAMETLQGDLDKSREESRTNFERFLRAEAELENFKKRMRKEQEETLKFAMTPLLKDLFGIVDNLERAMEHSQSDSESLATGIEMVTKQLQETLVRYGVSRVEAKGLPFDPNLHEAMSIVETNDIEENQVVDEFQAGYKMHGRIIRPAMVSVSKRSGGS